ncbi:uncharacterized protein LOC141651304 [Silene latifolia]|uniref:uncharacterized protein LOC141651304 n=1 Tax=Silene latifolia TaxID=37657 RepID=UPI003D77D74B
MRADGATMDKTRLGYARLMVEVQVGQDLPDKIYFKDEKGIEVCVLVEYEWRPDVCTACKRIGHTTEQCKKKTAAPAPVPAPVQHKQFQLWRPVRQVPNQRGKDHVPPSVINPVSPTHPFGGPTYHSSSVLIPHWCGINNNLHHPSGRIWIIWAPTVFQTSTKASFAQQITVEVKEIASGDSFWFTVVYGFNDEADRGSLWDKLKQLRLQITGPWCVCGDFNTILDYNERLGRPVLWSEVADFRQYVDSCDITDLQAQGSFFTWNNKQEPSNRVFSRIDRCLKEKSAWLKEGDANTAFYESDLGAIENAFLEYYQDLLDTSKHVHQLHIPTVRTGNVITPAHVNILLKPVTLEEVKACIFAIPPSKSPGPDGYSSQFFKDSWNIVREDIYNAVNNFFNMGKLLKQANATNITLIPKILILLVLWILDLLHVLIRSINALLNFCVQDWVNSTSYSLSLNGNSFGFFKGSRRLRQGDPLSPLLFTICMEYLSRILRVVGQQQNFKFHPMCGPLQLNHLLFADDLLLFSKGDEISIMWLLRAFSTFSVASGMCLNRDKSEIYFNGMASGATNGLHSYWSSIFLIPNGILNKIDAISRNYLWGGNESYLKAPNINWNTCCTPKEEGGLGIKASKLWNKALLDWTSYEPPSDCSWSWKKIANFFKLFAPAYISGKWLGGDKEYRVQDGYHWLRDTKPKYLLMLLAGGSTNRHGGTKLHKCLACAVYVAVTYAIWRARKKALTSAYVCHPVVLVRNTVKEVITRFWARNKGKVSRREADWIANIMI